MLKHTPLYEEHLKLNGSMVEFLGWKMPLHYGSQIEEHHAVRKDAGMFDVSHMGIIDITGEDAATFLKYLLANNIEKLKIPGTALYSCMLNHAGGILDDLIVYFLSPNHYRLVVNAGTTEKDLSWIKKEASPFLVAVTSLTGLVILAVQGPNARQKVSLLFPVLKENISALKPFQFLLDETLLLARTGYTGEDGVEIITTKEIGVELWQNLLKLEVNPIGLGARDTLRLEAGLNLYGQDMDETVTPFESNLSWTVALEPESRNFVGRSALIKQQELGFPNILTGIKLLERGILRHDQTLWSNEHQIGKVTSGSFSPTLNQSIGLVRLQNIPIQCSVDIRGKRLKTEINHPPFIKRRKST